MGASCIFPCLDPGQQRTVFPVDPSGKYVVSEGMVLEKHITYRLNFIMFKQCKTLGQKLGSTENEMKTSVPAPYLNALFSNSKHFTYEVG